MKCNSKGRLLFDSFFEENMRRRLCFSFFLLCWCVLFLLAIRAFIYLFCYLVFLFKFKWTFESKSFLFF
jgi:hypothetical protein